MRTKRIIVTMVMVCMFFLQPLTAKAADANAVDTLTLCNQQRKAVGLADLQWNTDLEPLNMLKAISCLTPSVIRGNYISSAVDAVADFSTFVHLTERKSIKAA